MKNSTYRVRILTAVVVAQLLLLVIIKFWPVQASAPRKLQPGDFTEEVLTLESPVITRQSSAPPPPPKPTAPIPKPTDEIIREEITDLTNIQFSNNPDPLSTSKIGEQGNSEGPVVGNPQRPPQIVRIVEAATPDAARRANIKAEITVKMLVDTKGDVENVEITEIRRYKGPNSDEYEIVQNINYGLMEVTREAALQWQFHPARDQGEPVKAYTTQIFTFGF